MRIRRIVVMAMAALVAGCSLATRPTPPAAPEGEAGTAEHQTVPGTPERQARVVVGLEHLRRLQEHPDVAERVSLMLNRARPTTQISLERSLDFVPMIEEILAEEGVPIELAYLPMVESRFRPHAIGRVALGLWQFTRSTARIYGLKVGGGVDERRDPVKSSRAAARYLRDLYDIFGRWDLALAAYNAGPGRVLRALAARPDACFFELAQHRLLPPITRKYVPKVLAISLIGPSPERYGLEIGPPTGVQLEARQGEAARRS